MHAGACMTQVHTPDDPPEPAGTQQELLAAAVSAAGLIAWSWDAGSDRRRVLDPGAPAADRADEQPGMARSLEIHSDDRLGVLLAWNEHLFQATDRYEACYRQRDLSGRWCWRRDVGRAQRRDGGGMALRVDGVTETLAAAPQQQDRTLLARAFDSTTDGICVLTEDCVVLEVNDAFEALIGRPRVHLIGQRLPVAQAYATGTQEPWQLAAQRGSWQGRMTLGETHASAGGIDRWITLSTLRGDDGSVTHYVMYAAELADRHEREEQLRRRANFDQLTGVASRAYFEMRLADAIEQAKRNLVPMGVLFIDLDRFKPVNDTWGHAAGDVLLRTVALRCQQTVRRADLLGRWGGDEFVVLLNPVRRPEDVLAVGRKIRAALLEPIDIGPTCVTISASVGAAVYPRDGVDAADLLQAADAAMYRVKSAGRGAVRLLGTAQTERAHGQLKLESEFSAALARGELQLAWQPRFRVRDATLVAVESALQWHSPAFGRVPPERWLPLFERSEASAGITEWMVGQACQLLFDWREGALAGIRAGINVTVERLLAPGFVDMLREQLAGPGVEPHRLEIELREAQISRQFDRCLDVMRELEGMGAGLVIDGFGRGGLALADLCRLPRATLKLDPSVVADLAHDHRAAGVIDAVVTLAHNLRLTLAADGVVTDAQLDHLQAAGCQEVQGALLAAYVSGPGCSEQVRLLSGRPSLAVS